MTNNNDAYLKTFLAPLKICKRYKPKFGKESTEEGLNVDQFLDLYGSDPFYAWCGLNSKLMYAAHKAAGGITSVYRQIGKGCENLFRQILIDVTQYADPSSATWSYETTTVEGKKKILSLDGRLELSDIHVPEVKERVILWIQDYCKTLGATTEPKGAVFEVRQGYKSKDSKRQNADLDNISVAWASEYLPVFAIFSAQIDGDLVLRYRNQRAGIVMGHLVDDTQDSLYAFSTKILGFDLAAFFKNNSTSIRTEIEATLQALLST